MGAQKSCVVFPGLERALTPPDQLVVNRRSSAAAALILAQARAY